MGHPCRLLLDYSEDFESVKVGEMRLDTRVQASSEKTVVRNSAL